MPDISIVGRHRDDRIGVGERSKNVGIEISGRGMVYEDYEGPYVAVSMPDESQVLETKDKHMNDNVLVLPIPYYETSNPKGGKTVYIGGN